MAIREPEEAFRLRPSIHLSQVIAKTALSAGLTTVAIERLEHRLALPTPHFKSGISSPDEQYRRIRCALRIQRSGQQAT